ncbi:MULTISPECIES: hypothetical protein [unclassified Bradyrhizobium]|uniref:hypothetical protein n=1 Tax=unclassified Bradyrhizobium TaxID=2631580 RepID=UPI001CD7926F|nr:MULTISPECIES: hypothetical protein [unclassified Bradyrhizobium]MCA1386024.1 hypothetical protein [Bradyrhizobium sp. BRP05]MCA1393822.1 hypothetical protein [Bradyrhizobium sp. IC3123]MCA1423466.1 hypothetical protein [Bradyrhizobium sp. BRP23]MCA1430640.1 hypothetical protein [Bradyrhizobium sp. NBAIM16]MCA1471216.1 hypothetical protein [Bradyrhizobium sp. IC3195]
MNPEALLPASNAIAESSRADVAKVGEQMNAKYDALDGELKQFKSDAKKKDEDDGDPMGNDPDESTAHCGRLRLAL